MDKYTKYKKKYIELKNKTLIKLYFNFKDQIINNYIDKFVDVYSFMGKTQKDKIKKNVNQPTYIKFLKAKYPDNTDDEIIDIIYQKSVDKIKSVYCFYIIKLSNYNLNINLDDIIIDNGKIDQVIILDKDVYIHLYPFSDTTTLKLCVPTSENKYSIEMYETMYNGNETFTMGGKKLLNHIYQVIEKIYYDRSQFSNMVPNLIFDELVSGKLDYLQYFIDSGAMPKNSTKIVRYGMEEFFDKTYDDYIDEWDVLKIPYSSVSECVYIKQSKYSTNLDSCFIDEGFILQKYNETLTRMEFKTHVVDGKISYIMARKNMSSYHCISSESNDPSTDLVSSDPYIMEILKDHREGIKKLCRESYRLINELYQLKIFRTTFEMNKLYSLLRILLKPHINVKFLDKFSITNMEMKLNEIYKNNLPNHIKEFLQPLEEFGFTVSFGSIFSTFIRIFKLKKLEKLKKNIKNATINKKINKLINLYKMTDMEFKNDPKINVVLDKKYVESYMRIDIALPHKEFNKLYINEIESYSSGKGSLKAMENTLCKEIIDNSPNNYLLQQLIRADLANNRIKFNKIKYETLAVSDISECGK